MPANFLLLPFCRMTVTHSNTSWQPPIAVAKAKPTLGQKTAPTNMKMSWRYVSTTKATQLTNMTLQCHTCWFDLVCANKKMCSCQKIRSVTQFHTVSRCFMPVWRFHACGSWNFWFASNIGADSIVPLSFQPIVWASLIEQHRITKKLRNSRMYNVRGCTTWRCRCHTNQSRIELVKIRTMNWDTGYIYLYKYI